MKDLTHIYLDWFFNNRKKSTIIRSIIELCIGILLIFQPFWAKKILTFFFPVLLGTFGLLFLLKVIGKTDKRSDFFITLTALVILGVILFCSGSRLVMWSCAFWAIAAGFGFIRSGFTANREILDRIVMLGGGIMSAWIGFIIFSVKNITFWSGSVLLGAYFIALAVFSFAVSTFAESGNVARK